MFAHSIRQQFVELMLRGIKTAELRSRPTTKAKPVIWSFDLRVREPPG